MRHRGWKIGFGLSWLLAVPFYYFGIEGMLEGVSEGRINLLSGLDVSIVLLMLAPALIPQVILGYFAFRR
ncbi:unnamed protein product [marine sediment metagenome]|uniref:Uncharacterized protein n=2 Tax=marine sediment metagenome TaxID=412755 RepID=X1VZ33_9ZZZZ